jgi:hypothetical protein
LLVYYGVALEVSAAAAAPGGKGVANELRDAWTSAAIERLLAVGTDDCTNVIEPRVVELDDFFQMSFRLNQDGGCIFFPNGDWIYLVSHSWHEDARIGDLSLAIDSQKRIYYNDGHVCGGIIHFYIGFETQVNSSQDFFQLFMSDCDDCKWYLLENNNSLLKTEKTTYFER